MKIGIDISQVVYGTGVSTYTRNLVKNLLLIDKENEYVLFGGSLRRRGELKPFLNSLQGSTFKARVFPIPPTLADLVWNRLHIFPIEWLIGKIDVFHSSDWSQPPCSAFKVTTIHDLVPFKFPELSHPRIVSAHRVRLSWVKREVDRVIVPSEATMEDLIQLGIDREKIEVIPEAPDPIFKPEKQGKIEKVKEKYKVRGRYILAVGITPRKNTERIIEAFEGVKTERELELIIIGRSYMKIEPKMGVKLLGDVDFEDLPALYSGAEALVYPSLYEGFGLPVLEAFACKTAVLTSNLGSLKEVARGAAILVEPEDVNSIVDGIKKVLRTRQKLIINGVKRVKKFSWENAAKETLKIYANK